MSSQSQSNDSPQEEMTPTVLRRILNESARLLSQNRPGEAVENLLPLYQKRPDNPDVAINLGGAYILQRKWDKAVRMLEKAVKINPDVPMLWTNLAAAYLGRLEVSGPRQQERAIGAYERALELDPKAPNVHYHLGLIYKDRNELLRASTFFQRAIEVNPADQDARLWLNRMEGAIAEQQAEAARQASPTDVQSADNMGESNDASTEGTE